MRFIWPLADHYITRGFDYKSGIYIGGMHAGLDLVRLQGGTAGMPIKSVAMGVVAETAWDKYSGHYIVLDHDGGWRSKYRHMVGPAPLAVGHPVVQGQTVGKVGSTGLSTGPHLHFDLWHRQKQDTTAFYKQGIWAHDPELYLGQEEDEMTDAEFLARLNKLLTQANIPATKDDGKTHMSASHTLGSWLDDIRVHRTDKAKHAASGGLKRGDRVTLN